MKENSFLATLKKLNYSMNWYKFLKVNVVEWF